MKRTKNLNVRRSNHRNSSVAERPKILLYCQHLSSYKYVFSLKNCDPQLAKEFNYQNLEAKEFRVCGDILYRQIGKKKESYARNFEEQATCCIFLEPFHKLESSATFILLQPIRITIWIINMEDRPHSICMNIIGPEQSQSHQIQTKCYKQAIYVNHL